MVLADLNTWLGQKVSVHKIGRHTNGALYQAYETFVGILRLYEASYYLEGTFGAVAVTQELLSLQMPELVV